MLFTQKHEHYLYFRIIAFFTSIIIVNRVDLFNTNTKKTHKSLINGYKTINMELWRSFYCGFRYTRGKRYRNN